MTYTTIMIHTQHACTGTIHDKLILHRDLKPENIVYRSKENDSDPVIVDFGFGVHATAIAGTYVCVYVCMCVYTWVHATAIAGETHIDAYLNIWLFSVLVCLPVCTAQPTNAYPLQSINPQHPHIHTHTHMLTGSGTQGSPDCLHRGHKSYAGKKWCVCLEEA